MNLHDRLYSKIRKTDSCWLWTAASHPFGYGVIRIDGKNRLAHRVMYELRNGPIPDGKYICHTCDNPACVNPEHLFIGTQKDNMQDCSQKGRARSSKAPRPGSLHPQTKLTEADVVIIRQRCANGETQGAVGADYSLTQGAISAIVTGKSWSHVPGATTTVHARRLTANDRELMLRLYDTGRFTQQEIADKFGVSRGYVSNLRSASHNDYFSSESSTAYISDAAPARPIQAITHATMK